MPKPTSRRQFRFLQAVAHGRSNKETSLTPASARKGLAEAGSYKSLPESRSKIAAAKARRSMSKSKHRSGRFGQKAVAARRSARGGY